MPQLGIPHPFPQHREGERPWHVHGGRFRMHRLIGSVFLIAAVVFLGFAWATWNESDGDTWGENQLIFLITAVVCALLGTMMVLRLRLIRKEPLVKDGYTEPVGPSEPAAEGGRMK